MFKHRMQWPWHRPLTSTSMSSSVRRRIRILQWIVPLGLVLLVVIYEIGPARWILERFGEAYHLIAEIAVYAVVGPTLAYWLLHFLGRWLDERETSEFQAQLLAHTREQTRISHELSDEALQTLFAASILLSALTSSLDDLSPEEASTLLKTEAALNSAIQQIRDHLENESSR